MDFLDTINHMKYFFEDSLTYAPGNIKMLEDKKPIELDVLYNLKENYEKNISERNEKLENHPIVLINTEYFELCKPFYEEEMKVWEISYNEYKLVKSEKENYCNLLIQVNNKIIFEEKKLVKNIKEIDQIELLNENTQILHPNKKHKSSMSDDEEQDDTILMFFPKNPRTLCVIC
jgi:hypothetical protein